MILRFFGEAVFALLISLKLIAISQISCCSSASKNDDLCQKIGNCKNTCKIFQISEQHVERETESYLLFLLFFKGVIKTDLHHS